MQFYLQYEELKRFNLDNFDNWVKTFARPERVAEVDVDTSHYRFVTRFAVFFNLPELSRMFSDIAIFHAMDEKDGIPVLNDYQDHVIKKNDALTEYMLSLSKRTEKIRSGEVDRSYDNMLKVSTDGRKAALDLRLVQREQPPETSKVNVCIRNVRDIYDKFNDCAQLVFCDYSTPKKDEFNVYREIKEGLMESGIPDKQIAFIHSYHTEERKIALYEKVNTGQVRVLIGSTFKLGIGANVQTRIKAIHHLDVPWRPADMVQREGRILRKGNQYDEVEIYRYICEGSFDAYSWQILESKQKFISQFLIGSSYQREASDLEDNVLTYAEVKALALSDPRMKTLAESRIELANLRIINNKYIDTKNSLKADEETIRKGMPALDEQIRGTELNCRSIENRSKDDYKELRKTLICFLDPDLIKQEGEALGDAWGFAFDCPREQSQKEPFFIVSKNNVEYRIESGMSAAGNAQRVSNLFHGLEDYLKDLKTRKAEKENRLVRIHEELESANPYSERIRELENEINELQEQMDTDK